MLIANKIAASAAFTTGRLTVQHWSDRIADADWLLQALPDLLTPPVLAQLPPSFAPPDSPDGWRRWISDRARECDVYTVCTSADDNMIGLLILAGDDQENAPVIHVGYLLRTDSWGQGYGSELVNGLVDKLADGQACRLLAGVAIDNPASARILQKAGFSRSNTLSDSDTDMFTRSVGRTTI